MFQLCDALLAQVSGRSLALAAVVRLRGIRLSPQSLARGIAGVLSASCDTIRP